MHDKTMLLKIAEGRAKPEKRSFENDRLGRKAMLSYLRKRATAAGRAKVIFAYEASCQGFGLYDEVSDAGFVCHVLAPTEMARSRKERRNKTDERDADGVLAMVSAVRRILAGNPLPTVWVPDPETRDDREVVRARLDVAEKLTGVKAQVRTLLKRNGMRKPSRVGKGWTRAYPPYGGLRGLTGSHSKLSCGSRVALGTLMRQMDVLEKEIGLLDAQVEALAETDRYAGPARALIGEKGVGLLTAMVFLTEMGDLSRFSNRKQIGAYLGLAPSSNESGEKDDRKGHITHHGNVRVRKVLCQATWARVRTDGGARAAYERIARRNPKHKKIAVVACMRRLGVRMWHPPYGGEAQRHAECFREETACAPARDAVFVE